MATTPPLTAASSTPLVATTTAATDRTKPTDTKRVESIKTGDLPDKTAGGYDCKNKMLVGAAILFGLGTVFFALVAAGVIVDPTILGGVAATAALAFAT